MAEHEPENRAQGTPDGAGSSRGPRASGEAADAMPGSTTQDFEDGEDWEVADDEEDFDEAGETVDESGRRHIRRAAPEGTEQVLQAEQERHTGLPDRMEAWRRRSATGAVLTAFALGLQEALDPERKEPAIIMQTSGEPPKDLPVQAQLEQLGPRQSTVSVRPWLLAGAEEPDEPSTDEAAGTEAE